MSHETQATNQLIADAEHQVLRLNLAVDLAKHLRDAGFQIDLITERHVRVSLSSRRLHAYEVQLALPDQVEPFITITSTYNAVEITVLD